MPVPDPPPPPHLPVLRDEVLSLASSATRVVDGTIGFGGHAASLLERGAQVLGIDQDPDAIAAVRQRLPTSRLVLLQANYSSPGALAAVGAFGPDFVLLDLGVSSWQLDADARGFSFRPGVSLDMRMAGAGRAESAAGLLGRATLAELTTIFRDFGDEPRAARLAREILRRREHQPFRSSDDLVNAIRAALGPRSGPADFARCFQAVRIAVNDELTGLRTALPALRDALVPSGILAVISYHSGEDRLVKHAFREWGLACRCPTAFPECRCNGRALGRVDPRRPLQAGAAEIAVNPRARSARLRGFRKADDPGPVLGDAVAAPLSGSRHGRGGPPARGS